MGSLTSNIALVHANAHNSKKDEKEADEGAFIYITHSNYNPGACAAIWQRMLEKYGNNDQHGIDLLLGPSDHPNHGARRDKYEKSLYEYSGKHVHVKDGKVTVNGKDFAQVAPDAGMSGAERAYFVQGKAITRARLMCRTAPSCWGRSPVSNRQRAMSPLRYWHSA